MQLTLEICTLASLDDLAVISRKTFVDAFEKDNSPEDFKHYLDEAFDKEVLKRQLANNDSSFYFVFADGALAGYFKLNRNQAQTDLKLPESIELERIYVLQDFQGNNIGQWMLNEIKKISIERQKEFIWLGVWENNLKAISFYNKNGFVKFGMHPYYVGNDKQMDWLMRCDLINFNAK